GDWSRRTARRGAVPQRSRCAARSGLPCGSLTAVIASGPGLEARTWCTTVPQKLLRSRRTSIGRARCAAYTRREHVQAVSCGEAVMQLLAAYEVNTVFGMAGTMTLELYRGIAR